jgi:hypothetical protein
MAILPPNGSARFVALSRRATKHAAWNVAGRSNQPNFPKQVQNRPTVPGGIRQRQHLPDLPSGAVVPRRRWLQ